MDLDKYQSDLQNWLSNYPYVYEISIALLVFFIAFIIFFITKKVLIASIHKITAKTKSDLDDILLNDRILRRLSYIPPIIFIHQFSFFSSESSLDSILDNILETLVLFFIMLAITAFLDAAVIVIKTFPKFKERPINGYAQVVKIIVYVIGIIFMLGIISGQSPWGLFAGLGALSAVIILVFKDTILSFVASIQISSYDLIKVGDWIEMPKLGVDGDIMDISLHTIKIRNFDKTITVIPTKSVVETTFKNWRGMTETGGRRIKRSIFIDQASIKFVDEEMLKRFEKFQLLTDYVKSKHDEISQFNNEKSVDTTELINGRRMTNVGTFRAYLKAYLDARPDIDKNLTFLIRQLQPGPNGLPIELYVFTTTTAWIAYEEIQSDIFDHLLAVINEFDLDLYQSPTGSDLRSISEIKK